MNREMNRQTEKRQKIDRQIYIQTDRKRNRKTERQSKERQTEIQLDK
jgi:hypothetical protein